MSCENKEIEFSNGGYVKKDENFSLGGVVSPAEHYYFTNGEYVPVNSVEDVLRIKEKDDKMNKNED